MSKIQYPIEKAFSNKLTVAIQTAWTISATWLQNIVIHKWNELYVMGCHYIGKWDSDEYTQSDVESVCQQLFISKLSESRNYVRALWGTGSTESYPISLTDSETEEVTTSSDSAGMHENSPISATIGDITTPSGKMKNESSGKVNRKVTRDNAHESLERIRAMQEIQQPIEQILLKAIESLIDEYQTMY